MIEPSSRNSRPLLPSEAHAAQPPVEAQSPSPRRRFMPALAAVCGLVGLFAACAADPPIPDNPSGASGGPQPDMTAGPGKEAAPGADGRKADAPPAPLGSSSAKLPPGEGEVMNNATKDASHDRSIQGISAIIKANRDGFRRCYEAHLAKESKNRGTYILHFVLNPDGSVKTAERKTDGSEIGNEGMDKCMAKTLKGMSFPKSKRGMETTINYPFGFTPHGGKSSK